MLREYGIMRAVHFLTLRHLDMSLLNCGHTVYHLSSECYYEYGSFSWPSPPWYLTLGRKHSREVDGVAATLMRQKPHREKPASERPTYLYTSVKLPASRCFLHLLTRLGMKCWKARIVQFFRRGQDLCGQNVEPTWAQWWHCSLFWKIANSVYFLKYSGH